MKVLAVDTSSAAVGVAVLNGSVLLGECLLRPARGRSEYLLEMIDFLLTRLDLAPSDADLLVAVTGPGSFTGLRIGIGAVRGLAMAAGRPAAGIPALQAMAASIGDRGAPLAPVLDAGRGEIYAGLYSASVEGAEIPRQMQPDAVLSPGRLREFLGDVQAIVFGPGAERYAEQIAAAAGPPLRRLPTAPAAGCLAAAAGRLALKRIEAGEGPATMPLVAHYVRRPDARLPG